jgi:NAD(P)H-hydrate epimerase
MQAIDRFAIRTLKIPSDILMEHAGYGVIQFMEKHFGSLEKRSAVVVCGKGNNGGDGYVAARGLLSKGCTVTVVSLGKTSALSSDAGANLHILQQQLKLSKNDREKPLRFISASGLKSIKQPDFIIDAIFGTGLNSPLRGRFRKVIEWMNRSNATIVSVDIPSGLNSNNGSILGSAVKSNLTVTFHYKKRGLFVGQGPNYTGIVEVADIAIPKELPRSILPSGTVMPDVADIRRSLPRRPFNAHKYSVGKVLVVAGSRGLTGAAAMTAQAAMRSGAGAVKLVCPKSVATVLSRKLTEAIVIPSEETTEGTLSDKSLADITPLLDWTDVLVVGPGLSQHPDTVRLIQNLVSACKGKLLLDADGINAFSGNIKILARFHGTDLIITPHTGEFSRLTGMTPAEIENDRIENARTLAKKLKCTIVLKGAPTVTGSDSGKIYINRTGNQGMATAGAGDILTGILAGLWSQKMISEESAYASVYLHGLAGDLSRARYGERSLMALDILEQLPAAFLTVERPSGRQRSAG